MSKHSLPYFDMIFESLEDESVKQALGKHVHWGYWDDANQADGSFENYASAAERLCRLVYESAHVESGQKLLDVGCGFGGTISSINDRFSNMQMTGLNIDPRQLEVARQNVIPQNENVIDFVEADAVSLPFADDSFDVVLAVECIFHFSSREAFLKELKRVLKPGGRLAFSDFIPFGSTQLFESITNFFLKDIAVNTYGSISLSTISSYKRMAREIGIVDLSFRNITKNTLPTYDVLDKLPMATPGSEFRNTNRFMGRSSRIGFLRYQVLAGGV